ncbi:hypothetical protein Tco_0187815, partial [Tanacetum coccineum]
VQPLLPWVNLVSHLRDHYHLVVSDLGQLRHLFQMIFQFPSLIKEINFQRRKHFFIPLSSNLLNLGFSTDILARYPPYL